MRTIAPIVLASLCAALTLQPSPTRAQQIEPWRGASPISMR